MDKPKVKGLAYLFAKKGVTRKQAKQMLTTPNLETVRETLKNDKNWSKVAPTESISTTIGLGKGEDLYSGGTYDKFKRERSNREKQLRKDIMKQSPEGTKQQKKKAKISAEMKAVYKQRIKEVDSSTSTCMMGEDPKCRPGDETSYKSGGKNYNYKTSKKRLNQDIRYVRRGTASNASPREQSMKDRTLDKRLTYSNAKEVNAQKAFGYSVNRLERLAQKKKK
jgi:hypothetical protein